MLPSFLLNCAPLLAADENGKWIMPIVGVVLWALAAWDFFSGRAAIGRYGTFVFHRDENPTMFFIVVIFKVCLGGFFMLLPFLGK